MVYYFKHPRTFCVVVITVIYITVSLLIEDKAKNEINIALQDYIALSRKDTEEEVKKIKNIFKQVYQILQVIGDFDGLKKIDRHGKNLDSTTNEAITKLHSIVKSNINVSEIYILPNDFDPEAIDPLTGNQQIPILMFDGTGSPQQGLYSNSDYAKITNDEQALKLDQVEIYEYKLIKEQIDFLKSNYYTKPKDDDAFPILSGKDVITCDNADYSLTKKDSDRKGLVFSMPYYDDKNIFKGTITAVVRNNNLSKMLLDANYALINQNYDYILTPETAGQELNSAKYVNKQIIDPDLYYCEIIDLEIYDPKGGWKLWAGKPKSDFMESKNLKSIINSKFVSYIILTIIIFISYLILEFYLYVSAKNKRQAEEFKIKQEEDNERSKILLEQAKLEAENKKRRELDDLANIFESKINSVISFINKSSNELLDGASEVGKITKDATKSLSDLLEISSLGKEQNSQINQNAQKLQESMQNINHNSQESYQITNKAKSGTIETQEIMSTLFLKANKVTSVVNIITDIADQINLLALNANIESARAGEAGKGFGVVANEVKSLANQVSKASSEIAKQIYEMESYTKSSIDSVSNIIRLISDVASSATFVCEAVSNQLTSTDEISSTIKNSSQLTNKMYDQISMLGLLREEIMFVIINLKNKGFSNVFSASSYDG